MRPPRPSSMIRVEALPMIRMESMSTSTGSSSPRRMTRTLWLRPECLPYQPHRGLRAAQGKSERKRFLQLACPPARTGIVDPQDKIRSKRGFQPFPDKFPRREQIAQTHAGEIMCQRRAQQGGRRAQRRDARHDFHCQPFRKASRFQQLQHQPGQGVHAGIAGTDQSCSPACQSSVNGLAAAFDLSHHSGGKTGLAFLQPCRHHLHVGRISRKDVSFLQRGAGLGRKQPTSPGPSPTTRRNTSFMASLQCISMAEQSQNRLPTQSLNTAIIKTCSKMLPQSRGTGPISVLPVR